MNKGSAVLLIGVVVVVAATWYWSSHSHTQSQSSSSLQAVQSSAEGEIKTHQKENAESLSQVGAPKIFFPETTYSFGIIAQESKVSHTFVVRNIGDAPLKLINAKAG
jgi:hypothetical protein